MNKVKIFTNYESVKKLEDAINTYLAENPKITVLSIFATEGLGGKTVYLFYIAV